MRVRDKVLVSEETYNQLLRDSHLLSCLMAVGVEEWNGFLSAETIYQDEQKDKYDWEDSE